MCTKGVALAVNDGEKITTFVVPLPNPPSIDILAETLARLTGVSLLQVVRSLESVAMACPTHPPIYMAGG